MAKLPCPLCFLLLCAIKSLVAFRRPFPIHIKIIFLYERPYGIDFYISQTATIFKARIAAAHDEEFCRTSFRQLSVAGVNVHRLDDAMGSEIKVISEDLKE